MTRKQDILMRQHGTVEQFEAAAWRAAGEITPNEIRSAIHKYRSDLIQAGSFTELEGPQKIVSSPISVRLWAAYRKFANIVVTNGCFDILHAGHIHLLTQAKLKGDYLVVLLNDDTSVRQLKGQERPINNEDDRAYVLSALEVVDLVVIFHEARIDKWLHRIQPKTWVKGGDYTRRKLDKGEVIAAKEIGCRICLVPVKHDLSTTKLHAKIKQTLG